LSARRHPRVGRPQQESPTIAILDATLEVLSERGYHDTTLDEIVARARSSKPTVYRRWPSKAGLVAAAVHHGLTVANPVAPDSGDPAEDVRRMLLNAVHALTRTPLGGAVRTLVAQAESDPELDDCLATIGKARRAVLETVLARVLQSEDEIDLAVDVLLGVIYFRFLVRRSPISPDLARRLVDFLFRHTSTPVAASRRRTAGGKP
jgi:AcrR family transcriptional regulator